MSFGNKEKNSNIRCANGNRNNNNNLTKLAAKSKAKIDDDEATAQKIWDCRCVASAGKTAAAAAGFVEDKGGGMTALQIDLDETDKNAENGAAACDPFVNHYALYDEDDDDDAGAYDSDEAAAAAIDFHSNRNSRNNSTDNLSYASDQFYAKDLIFLEDEYDEDDDDNGAEIEDDISLNSDDCVYAYRGEGADFDFPLKTISGRTAGGIAGNSMDDEMDFLEMDFDPDTLSEIENGGHSIGSGAALSADALLLQRDLSQVRHANVLLQQQQQQRQLFSSPIDGLNSTTPVPATAAASVSAISAAAPMKVLSSQTLLGKNFGRMSLHLDQIKGIDSDCENSITKPLGCETNFERLNGLSSVGLAGDVCNTISSSVGANQTTDLVIDFPSSSAHSLPNTLHAFGRASNEDVVSSSSKKVSPTKVTGAKPKRLSTFSTSSSTSSKNSCKSRTSLRSVIGPSSLYNSVSFDERSVSCTEFRSAPPPPLTIADDTSVLANSANVLANASSAAATVANQFDINEDSSCLDCLEKEFLASTIGKAMDEKPFNCSKCRRKRYNLNKLEFQQQQMQQQKSQLQQSLRCRSGSPSAFFTDIAGESFYEFSHENWLNGSGVGGGNGLSSLSLLSASRRSQDVVFPTMTAMLSTIAASASSPATAIKCDIIGSEKLRKNLTTEKETVTLPMADVNEENITSALKQLKVDFNGELIKLYFENLRRQQQTSSTNSISGGDSQVTKSKEFKDLKHFLLHESKKNCNHPKLKRLIEHAVAPQQIEVQFKKDSNNTESAIVNVSATDILRHWSRNNDILCLQELDDRFKSSNVLGKIANLIRQAKQTKRPTSTRTQIEYIAIPQYYPDGFLIIKKLMQNA